MRVFMINIFWIFTTFDLVVHCQKGIQVRTQSFSEKSWRKVVFFYILISFEKILIVSKFLLELPKCKEIIRIITFVRVHDLLLTFLRVKTNMQHSFKNGWLILINNNYMINYKLSCLNYIHFVGIICFFLRVV